MLLRLIIPYIILAVIVTAYFYFRRRKLGPVLLKVDRKFFSVHNTDSFLLIMIIAAAAYFLLRFELQNFVSSPGYPEPGHYAVALFYGVLILAVIAREAEKPALREKGISSPRGLYTWGEIDSYRWSKQLLTLNVLRGKRIRPEMWPITDAESKRQISYMLKKKVPRKQKRAKK